MASPLARRLFLSCLAALAAAPRAAAPARAQGSGAQGSGAPVDLALVLAVDVSASVDHEEYALMMGGYAAAFRDPSVIGAATEGERGAIAVTMIFWSGPGATAEAAGWSRIDGPAAAEAFAAAIDAAPRDVVAGATSLGGGVRAALAALGRCPFPAARMVIDVSGDGQANAGPPLATPRALAQGAGITINALAVTNEDPDLPAYYRGELITGPGSFVMEALDYESFAEAILRKLLRELGARLFT
ncbi:MAG: DUF1194 domain-containing protein [Alphaproteobacteria bacterium]|nr:DUF1194 domain-containing protein [Alphaproteobacteria bacterium]